MVSKLQLPTSENKESVSLEIIKDKFSFIFCNKPFLNCLAGIKIFIHVFCDVLNCRNGSDPQRLGLV